MDALLVYAWGPLSISNSRRPLPSLDPACLSAAAFLSLTQSNFILVESNSPKISCSGALPVCLDESGLFHGLDAILARLASTIDHDLAPRQIADCRAIQSFVVDCLSDVLNYFWLIHNPHSKTTNKLFASLLSIPSRFLFLNKQRRNAIARINTRTRHHWTRSLFSMITPPSSAAPKTRPIDPPSAMPTTISLAEEQCTNSLNDILNMARHCYTVLATLLNDRPYFLGNTPHAIDAVVFGYLALHYYPKMPNDDFTNGGSNPLTLATLLRIEFPVLVAYLDRMYTVTKIDSVRLESPKHNVISTLTTHVTELIASIPPTLLSFWNADVLYSLGTAAAGILALGSYVFLVRSNEERQLASAIQYVQAVAQQRADIDGDNVIDENDVEEDDMYLGDDDDEFED